MTTTNVREALTASQISDGWRFLFSTENPYNPVSLKAFTKIVQWVEHQHRAALAVPSAQAEQPAGHDLHPATASLVQRFSQALADKLAAAEKKYGYSDGWLSPDWMDECRQHLREHIEKGDPRDVAAYCAFLWHHGASTASQGTPSPAPQSAEPMAQAQAGEGGDFNIALNTMHPRCHEAADLFWAYWNENGETHRHGYYESTWGAINRALRAVGIKEHNWSDA